MTGTKEWIIKFGGLLFVFLNLLPMVCAQNLRIHHKSGTVYDIPIEQIDSVTFVEKEIPEESVSLTGSWLWGSKERGYYELITFDDDNTYVAYDNYFMDGFNTMTYGWYLEYGNLLTLQSNGFGYNRKYTWLVTGLTENALEVMTKMGPFVYYKLQPEVITINKDEEVGSPEEGTIVFADGIVVKATDKKLLGLVEGSTYVLIKRSSDDKIVAYKIVVK